MIPSLVQHLQKLPQLVSKPLLGGLVSSHYIPHRNRGDGTPTKFTDYNKKTFPIQGPNEPRRPAFVCYLKPDVRISVKNLFYSAWLVRGLPIEEAIKQVSFISKKGGAVVKEALIEAQKLAVEEHNVEFKSNLWVAESFASKAFDVKGIRRHAKRRVGEVRYHFSHYFVRLEEGKPPEDYYLHNPRNKEQLLDDYINSMRMRNIAGSI